MFVSLVKFFVRAANGLFSPKFRSENAHLALLNSAFRASFGQKWPHFRFRTKNLTKLVDKMWKSLSSQQKKHAEFFSVHGVHEPCFFGPCPNH